MLLEPILPRECFVLNWLMIQRIDTIFQMIGTLQRANLMHKPIPGRISTPFQDYLSILIAEMIYVQFSSYLAFSAQLIRCLPPLALGRSFLEIIRQESSKS